MPRKKRNKKKISSVEEDKKEAVAWKNIYALYYLYLWYFHFYF
jgi:hypothetical protein